MPVRWAVILGVFVAASGVLGRVYHGKRSDFSMYDNQFYRVGDTELDDEITDCALVEHQFKKGYIRLREYLERKRGCGRKGKLSNIAGIEKSTEDDINNDNIAEIAKSTTEDYHFSAPPPAAPAVNKAPRPKTIPQVINTYQPQSKMTYVPHGLPVPATAAVHVMPAQQPAVQMAVQRNQAARPAVNDYERKSQNLALSFKNNPQYTGAKPSPQEHNTFEVESAQPQIASAFSNNDQYTRLASGYDHYNAQKPQHDLLQTFYPDTLHERSYAPSTTATTVAVGQPLYKQPSYSKTQALKGASSAPNKISVLLKNAMKNFDNVAVNKPGSVNTFNEAQVKPQIYNKPAVKPVNPDVKSSPDENVDDAHADMRDPDKDAEDINSESIDQKPASEPGIDDQPANQATNKPSVVPLKQRPGNELRPDKPVTTSFSGFQKPVPVVKGNPMLVKSTDGTAAQAPAPVLNNVNLRHPSINLDVLKNKIMHSTNATFLRRMLALVQKITHHKDYQKLQAPERSFVAQANTAVQALNTAYNERVSTLPVSVGTGNQLYGNNNALRKKSAVQTLNTVQNNRFAMSPGNVGTSNQLYKNDYALRKKSAVQAYNDRVAMSPTNLGTTNTNQLYGNDYTLSKKFEIERNPYYQNYYQYRQPYYRNIQSMRYGLYNGNTP